MCDTISMTIDLLNILFELFELKGREDSNGSWELPRHGVEHSIGGAPFVFLVYVGHGADELVEGLEVLVGVGS